MSVAFQSAIAKALLYLENFAVGSWATTWLLDGAKVKGRVTKWTTPLCVELSKEVARTETINAQAQRIYDQV